MIHLFFIAGCHHWAHRYSTYCPFQQLAHPLSVHFLHDKDEFFYYNFKCHVFSIKQTTDLNITEEGGGGHSFLSHAECELKRH